MISLEIRREVYTRHTKAKALWKDEVSKGGETEREANQRWVTSILKGGVW